MASLITEVPQVGTAPTSVRSHACSFRSICCPPVSTNHGLPRKRSFTGRRVGMSGEPGAFVIEPVSELEPSLGQFRGDVIVAQAS